VSALARIFLCQFTDRGEGPGEDPVAEQRAGAERGRWVNEGVVQDEYGDFVRAGRPWASPPMVGGGRTCRTWCDLA
jgi:hypothetical protein